MNSNQSIGVDEVVAKWEKFYAEGGGYKGTATQTLVSKMHPLFKKRGVKSILDIGCGRGCLLSTWESFGYSVAGTEIVPSLLSTDLKLFTEIYPYQIKELSKFEDRSYDVVSLVDVVEFLDDVQDIDRALLGAFRIARVAVVFTVNLDPPSDMRETVLGDERWHSIAQKVAFSKGPGAGGVDITARKGTRVVLWKRR